MSFGKVFFDLQKNLIPLPSHSTLQLSIAIKPAALVAEYIARHGAAIVAATEDKWCKTGDREDEASSGTYIIISAATSSIIDQTVNTG